MCSYMWFSGLGESLTESQHCCFLSASSVSWKASPSLSSSSTSVFRTPISLAFFIPFKSETRSYDHPFCPHTLTTVTRIGTSVENEKASQLL